MQFFALAAAVLPILAVNAVDIPIKVGDGGLVFNPSNVTANVGDNLQFQFVSGNHTATQSTFVNPCQQMAGGITSGFMNVTAGAATIPQWTVTVNDTSAPLWFYCQQTTPKNHCQSGMVFAVNPTAQKSFAAFQQAAMNGASNSTASGSGSAGPAPTGTGSGSNATSGTGSGSTTPSGTSSATTSQSAGANNNSGVKVAGGAASLMAVVGLVAGLAL